MVAANDSFHVLGFLFAASVSALIATIDAACKFPEPSVAIRTREWIYLIIINFFIAAIIIYILYSSGYVNASYLGLASLIIGYPLIVRSSFCTIRMGSVENHKPIGPEIILHLVDNMFREGMEKSIKEKEINLTKEWRSRNIADLGIHVKDYLSSYSNNADADIEYVDKLIADSHLNPNNTEKNSRALLKLVKKCDQHPHQLAEQEATKPGRQRGICFILKQCKK